MGLDGLMSGLGMNFFAVAGLLVCFAAFVGILIWLWTRPQAEIEAQARLCLEEDDETATAV